MPKLDKPIIGDVTIETPPETIDPEMEVPEMLAPAPETDTIYNPPMQQGVQQASMLNEFLKQATGEKPLASLNIGDYVQCATAKINLYPYHDINVTSSAIYINSNDYFINPNFKKLHIDYTKNILLTNIDKPLYLVIKTTTKTGVTTRQEYNLASSFNDILVLDDDLSTINIFEQLYNQEQVEVHLTFAADLNIYGELKEEK